MEKIIAQGAEASLIHKNGRLIKRRYNKGYRSPVLDKKIRLGRTRREAKILDKAYKIIPVPKIISVNEKTSEIEMDYVEGKKLSDHLDEFKENDALKICRMMGENTARLHNHHLVHGDLTTSNMIYLNGEKSQKDFCHAQKCKTFLDTRNCKFLSAKNSKGIFKQKEKKLYFIDFGLGFHSERVEDKAVDLHLLKQALESKHFKKWELYFSEVIKSYKSECNNSEKVLSQFKKVESRGRYKGKH
ncbi:MAG: Kae1-associated serine/threonine protein kinase [Nanoarchaeota archaeon]|nr:Kae1-associated serine/threonine protein kinase [Nanoarchaeota archaeon]